MTIDDEVPQRCCGVRLPVAPLVRNLKVKLDGEDDVVDIVVDLQVGAQSKRLLVCKGVNSYEGNGVLTLGWITTHWSTLGRDIERVFALPEGPGAQIATLMSRISEVVVLAVKSRGILGAIEIEAELRGVLEGFAMSSR